ncbi:MAG TPA: hypothetical protein PLE73_04015, partial [Spirochaetota bacterium]|nr:hypothetical protein [Spirochaetota bacterium]
IWQLHSRFRYFDPLKRRAGLPEDTGALVEKLGADSAVLTLVNLIRYRDRDFTFGKPDVAGPMLTKLYEQLTGIQYGEIEDRHGWLDVIEV